MDDLFPTVCVGLVLKMLKFPDGSTRIVCQGQYRARLVERRPDRAVPHRRGRALRGDRRGGGRARRPGAPRQPVLPADGRPEPADPRGAPGRRDEHPRAGPAGRPARPRACRSRSRRSRALLGEINVRARLERLGQYLSRQLAVLELSTKIQEQVGIGDHQGPARPLPPPADQGDPGGAGRERGRQPRAQRALGADQEGRAARPRC